MSSQRPMTLSELIMGSTLAMATLGAAATTAMATAPSVAPLTTLPCSSKAFASRWSWLPFHSARGNVAIGAVVASAGRAIEPPNVEQLCEKARLSLTPEQVEEIGPQISRVIDWFAQLQEVDLTNVAPAIRVGDSDSGSALRKDEPSIFAKREAMLAAVPDKQGPFIKVPKILNENMD